MIPALWGKMQRALGTAVDTIISTVNTVLSEAAQLPFSAWLSLSLALTLIASLSAYLKLKKRFGAFEAELQEKNVTSQSDKWSKTARNLQQNAQKPEEVARAMAINHIILLNEAAEAWLKGSNWKEAYRVTTDLLHHACHAIGAPGNTENQILTCSQLIGTKLKTFVDLSRAAEEAPSNACAFLDGIYLKLRTLPQSSRIIQILAEIERASLELDPDHDVSAAQPQAA
jgi:hypothetical protein